MRKIAITILSLLALGQAPALAQATDQVAELQQNSDWFKTSFRELWTACIERSRDLQFIEDKLIQGKGARAVYRAWVLDGCTNPGTQHYCNVKPGYGPQAEASPNICVPPHFEGKPLIGNTDALSLAMVIRKVHDRLSESVLNYVCEPTGIRYESDRKAIIEMCGEEAVARLDASLSKRKNTGPVDVSSIDSNWYYTAFRNLWSSHIGRDPYLQFVELKLIKDKNARPAYKPWLTNMSTTPGDEQSIQSLEAPNTTTLFHKAPIVDGKPILGQAETVQVNETVKSERFKLATYLKEYVHTDSEEMRSKAKTKLIEMCGEEAIRRLDKAVSQNKTHEPL
ncbi:MAG: hypothetical protein WC714_19960 [Candidatus Obscuribacterales bacterium]